MKKQFPMCSLQTWTCLQLEAVQRHNSFRGLFVYGPAIRVLVLGLPQVQWVEFAERSSWVLPTSRSTTRRLYERLSAMIAPGPRAAET